MKDNDIENKFVHNFSGLSEPGSCVHGELFSVLTTLLVLYFLAIWYRCSTPA